MFKFQHLASELALSIGLVLISGIFAIDCYRAAHPATLQGEVSQTVDTLKLETAQTQKTDAELTAEIMRHFRAAPIGSLMTLEQKARFAAAKPEPNIWTAYRAEVGLPGTHPQRISASNELSALGFRYNTGNGVVAYVDPNSSVDGAMFVGDNIVSVDGLPWYQAVGAKNNFGNAGTFCEVVWVGAYGRVHRMEVERKPIDSFAPFLASNLRDKYGR